MTNAVTRSHTAHCIYKWRVRGSHLECATPSCGIVKLDPNKMFAFTGFDCIKRFVEGTCYKHLAKGNKQQQRGALGGTEDDFTAPSELHPSACLSPSLSKYDYIMHNLGLHHCLESSTYIFQSRELILVLCSFPCPRHVR